MVCKLCEKRQNIDPICAFDNFYKVFASNNGNCITMNILRDISKELRLYYRDVLALYL